MKQILFFIGLIFLCVNTLRFVLGNYAMIISKKHPVWMKIYNVVETVGITIVLIILIINYYS